METPTQIQTRSGQKQYTLATTKQEDEQIRQRYFPNRNFERPNEERLSFAPRRFEDCNSILTALQDGKLDIPLGFLRMMYS